MDCDELRSFLVEEEGVPAIAAQALHDQNMNGRMFVRMTSSADRLREMATIAKLENELTAAVIMDLMDIRERVESKNALIGDKKGGIVGGGARRRLRPTSGDQSEDTSENFWASRDGPITRQVERLFLNPSKDSKGYTWNNYIKNENGAASLEPSREFKRLDFTKFPSIEDAKDAFLERVYEFSFACMNARLNGTLYFGVEDGHLNDTCHGAIKGNFLTSEDMNKLQEILEVHLTRRDAKLLQGLPPEEIDAVCNSIKALQFVPVNKGVPKRELEKAPPASNLYVIELDVEPGSDWCENFKFKLNVRRDGAKGRRRKKSGKETDELREFTYFFRDGSQTISFKDSDKADMKRIEKAIVARKHHEEMKLASLMDSDTSKRIMSILSLKRSSGFPNETIRYVLLLNDLEIPAGSLEWVAKMEWFLILDFTEESLSEPLKSLKEANLRQIPTIGVDDLAKLKNEEVNVYLYSVCGSSTTLHINCVPKGELDNWQQSGGLGLTKLISLANEFDHTPMSDVVIITLLGSHRRLQFIAEAIKEFSKVLPVTQMACLHENPKNAQVILQQVEPFFGHLWREQTFCVNFRHLNNILLKIMGQENESEHMLPCSFGHDGIPKKIFDHFRKGGITIVPSDVCSDVNSFVDSADSDAFVEKCEKDIEKYLKGTIPPPWILFYVADNMRNPGPVTNKLTKGLVHRDITDAILYEVKRLEAGTENIVVRLPIVHMPSAGATTIARHVLWCLKDDRKCAIIDGNHYRDEMTKLQEVADSILTIRALGENDDKVVQGTHPQHTCPTIIVLFDNCHQQMAKTLTKYVEKNCEKKGIVSRSPILVIMCLYSMFKYQPERVDQFDVENRNLHWIDRRLSLSERKRFSDKLAEIRNKRTTVDDLVNFVILAYANEEDSEFVRHVVNKTLADMNEREKGLLVYLAVLKYYSNGWLPNQLVLNFTYGQLLAEASTVHLKEKDDGTLKNVTQAHRNMSPQFESLVTIDDTMPNASGGGSFWLKKNFVSISHATVAYNILKALVPRNKLANMVKQMLLEKAITDTSCQREHVHKVFRQLLTQRTINEKTHMKDQLSKVIEAIVKSENKERAVDVLECAYNVVDDGFNKAHIAQTIARIYRDWDGMWEKAKTWANNAVQQAPNNFAIRDTLGRVYLSKQLRHIENIKTKAIQYYVPEHPEVLDAWHHALTEFRIAQDLYYMNKKMERKQPILDEDKMDDDDTDYGVATSTPFGIVEANIKLLEFLLKSEDLKDPKSRERFVSILMESDSSLDFSIMFSHEKGIQGFSWQPFHADIVDIFNTTRDCMDLVTRKLCYIDLTLPKSLTPGNTHSQKPPLYNGWMNQVAKQVQGFNKIFGYQRGTNNLDCPRTNHQSKLAIARRILQSGQASSFGWLSRGGTSTWTEETKLKEYCHCLRKMEELSQELNSPLLVWDKLYYINVAFAYHVYNLREGAEFHILDFRVVKQYVAELVRSKVTSPDPYFFFTMIFFPNALVNSNNEIVLQSFKEDELNDFIRCMKRLHDFKQDDFYWVRSRFVFYLGPGDNRSMNRFLPGMGSGMEVTSASRGKRLKLSGVLDENKDVVVRLGGGAEGFQELKIKNSKPYQRNKPSAGSMERVTFNLTFTYSGPMAVNVVSVEPEYERQRVLDSARRH